MKKAAVRKRGKKEEEEERIDLLDQELASLLPLSFPLSPQTEKFLSGFVFTSALSVYIYTAYPDVSGGEGGQLLASICTSGIPRSPGYPLFTLFSRLALSFVPFGSPAWRIGILCSLFGALSSHFVFKTVKLWTNSTVTGVLSGLMYAFSPLVWNYSTHANIFALNNLLIALMLYCVACFAKNFNIYNKTSCKYAYLATLAGGLGMANHNNIIFLAAPTLLWLCRAGKKFLWDDKASFLILGGNFIIGYLANFLLLLPIFFPGPASWGNISSIRSLLVHVARQEPPSFSISEEYPNPSTALANLYHFYSTFGAQFLYVGIIFLLLGISAVISGVIISNKRNSFGMLLSILFGIYLVVLACSPAFPNHPLLLHKYFLQEQIIGSMFVGYGASFFVSRLLREKSQQNYALVGLTVILLGLQFGLNFPQQNQHDNRLFYHYGHSILDPLPNNSILLLNGDMAQYVTEYYQYCEKVRPDVALVNMDLATRGSLKDMNKNITFPGLAYRPLSPDPRAFDMKKLLEANIDKHEIFSVGPFIDDKTQFEGYTVIPFGMGLKHVKTSEKVPTPWEWESTLDPSLPSMKILPNTTRENSWENVVVQHFWKAYEAKANMFIITGSEPANEDAEKSLWKAAEILELVRKHTPHSRFALKHLGFIYENLLDHHEGRPELYALMIRSWEEYVRLPKERGDKKYDKIKIALREYKKKLVNTMHSINI